MLALCILVTDIVKLEVKNKFSLVQYCSPVVTIFRYSGGCTLVVEIIDHLIGVSNDCSTEQRTQTNAFLVFCASG